MTAAGNRVLASALAGAATGARSFTGIGALAVTARGAARTAPDRWLAKRAVKGVIALAAVQEYVMDTLPQTPSRLDPPGAIARGVGAAASGVIVARRDGADDPSGEQPDEPHDTRITVACVAASVAAAAATAWLGSRFRARGADRFGHDWIGAVVEDAAVLGLAAGSVRLIR